MRLAEIRERIAAMGETITGIEKTFARPPRVLQNAELPALVVFVGRSTYNLLSHGEQMNMDNRVYDVVLYAASAGDGTEGQSEEECETLMERVKAHYIATPGLELSGSSLSVYDTEMLGDSGIQYLRYPLNAPNAKAYIGSVFQIRVSDLEEIDY